MFNATVVDAKNNPVSVTVAWTATGGSISGGTFTPDKVGTYTITATSGTLSGTAEVTVGPGKLASIEIDPKNATLDEGKKVKFTIKNPKDAKGNDIPLTSLTITWSVSNASLGSVSQTGEFTASKAGMTAVSASVTDGKATKPISAPIIVTAKPKSDLFTGSSMMLWLLLIIVIVVIAVVVALVAMRKRKKAQPEFPEYGFYPQYGPPPQGMYQQPMPQQPYPDQSGYPPQQQYGQPGEQEPQWTRN